MTTKPTKAQELAAKAKRLAERQQPPAAQDAGHTAPEGAAPVRVPRSTAAVAAPLAKPVRSTLDLSPAVHRDLQAWLNESAVRMGRARLTKQQVLEALVKRLLMDEALAKLILSDLKGQ